ncbi:MAG: leucine-rich repeat domain-containing protein [Faecalicoccus sp.]|nr:leucine-rich repeat domain-containing protein [Faecalicoccus sp.]
MSFTIVSQTLKKYTGNDRRVVVPDGIVEIDDYAFYGASNMEEIILPQSLKLMGNNVFYDCESLERIILPDSVSYIGSGLFARCKNLKSVTLSNRLTNLNKITFFQCENLTDVVFGKNLTRISRACFEQCHSLKNVILPDSLKILEENVFDDCTALEKVILSSHLERIGDNAFFNCPSLKELVLPVSLKEVGKGAFETRGKLSLIASDAFFISSKMFDNNWNMNWNFGANGRYNGKNEDNYQLVNSYLPSVNLKEWKPEARCILSINYLETYQNPIQCYQEWIKDNTDECIHTIMVQKRYSALHQGIDLGYFKNADISPYLYLVEDPKEKARLMETRSDKNLFDDLMDML